MSQNRQEFLKLATILQTFIGLSALALLIWEAGWPLQNSLVITFERATWLLIILALILDILPKKDKNNPYSKRRPWGIMPFCGLAAVRFGLETHFIKYFGSALSPSIAALIALVLVQITLLVSPSIHFLRMTRRTAFRSIRPEVLFTGSFAVAIGLGTLFLKTPNMSVGSISWIEALFTTTSAVCVTGLTVVDTELSFTPKGQVLILMLIQVGGLGIMTLTYFMSLLLGQGISIGESVKLRDMFSESNVGSMQKFTLRIVIITFMIEMAGAILIRWAWADNPARVGREWWDAVFHSVSAFCNAGFSTFSMGLAEPEIATNRALQVIIMILVISGGIGFSVLLQFPLMIYRWASSLWHRLVPDSRFFITRSGTSRVRVHSRLTVQITFLLLVSGFVLFLISSSDWSGNGLWEAAFNSVSSRTAGFHINDFGSYNFPTIVWLCVFMFIGGSPGGTAGGVKTTTAFIVLAGCWEGIRGRKSLHVHERRVPAHVTQRCIAIVILSLVWIMICVFLLSLTHPDLLAPDLVFEVFSAFGTVGLSRGITAEFNDFGKLILILNMFAGRIGLVTLIGCLLSVPRPRQYELPDGKFPL